jgi:hypothetical protein
MRYHIKVIFTGYLRLDYPTNCTFNIGAKLITNLYGLDGAGFEPRWGRDFSYPSRPAPWLNQPPVQ